MCWWPDAKGMSLEQVMSAKFSFFDALTTMSLEYGFSGWQEVEKLEDTKIDMVFEQALDDLLSGNINALRSRLNANPDLVSAQTKYGHSATLLHYLGANGVESHRQRTPLNAVELAKLMIDSGANINAKAYMYGGEQTPFDLASTSNHPMKAGISEDLNKILQGY